MKSPPKPSSPTHGSPQRRGRKRRVHRVVLAILGLILVLIAVGVALGWRAFGTAPSGALAERIRASRQYADGAFRNQQPIFVDYWRTLRSLRDRSEHSVPTTKLPVRTDTLERLAEPPGPLRVTWLGHSTTLMEIGGKKLLTDPVFGRNASPIPSLGPKRWYPPPIPLEALRDVDVVLISHDHYDHLDQPTIERMKSWKATFIAPLGVAAHLEYWGIDSAQIVSVDWWDEVAFGDLLVIATPSRHGSGRYWFDNRRTLWLATRLYRKNAACSSPATQACLMRSQPLGNASARLIW